MEKGKHSTFNTQHSTSNDADSTVLEFNDGSGEKRPSPPFRLATPPVPLAGFSLGIKC